MASIDVRGGLAVELKRLVRDVTEWPITDRRRFRNLLLDASTSDALPLAELLLRVTDVGLLRTLPERSAPRAAWDVAVARLATDVQSQLYVEAGVARFLADAWAGALGPDPGVIPAPAPATARSAPGPKLVARSTVTPPPMAPTPPRAATNPPSVTAQQSAQLYRQSNMLMLGVAVLFTVFVALAFRDTNRRAAERSGARGDTAISRTGVTPRATGVRPPSPGDPGARSAAAAQPTGDSTVVAQDSSTRADSATPARPAPRGPTPVTAGGPRTTDDVLLTSGRVIEGRVESIRQQTVSVTDLATGLEFEVDKSEIDRIVTRTGRVLRFGDDNSMLMDDERNVSAALWAGRYTLRYAERWGVTRGECATVAREFAPGVDVIVRHQRGAPMLKFEFVNGQGYNATVRPDGVFETGDDTAPQPGPRNSFVRVRLSGRLERDGGITGITRISAITRDRDLVCDLALTVSGARRP